MFRLALVLDVIIAPTLVGMLVLVTMMVPAFQAELGEWMLIAAVAGFVLSIPACLVAAKVNSRRPA
jgi:hypothetical protein